MVEVSIESHNMGPIFYRLTSVLFHVNRPSHSLDAEFSKFDLENMSRSWVRWMLKVTTRVQHSIDSHPFCSMSTGHPIPEIWLFQNLALKIQGQGNGWGQSLKSESGCNILSIYILSFHVNRPYHSWDTAFSKFDLENPRSWSNDHDVAQL